METGTHVEILGEQGLWWPATIAGREEDVDGRLVHEVEYDGYQGEQYWHMLDDEQWRLATATADAGTNAAASTKGEESGGESPRSVQVWAQLQAQGIDPMALLRSEAVLAQVAQQFGADPATLRAALQEDLRLLQAKDRQQALLAQPSPARLPEPVG